jgi:hypothetical protein
MRVALADDRVRERRVLVGAGTGFDDEQRPGVAVGRRRDDERRGDRFVLEAEPAGTPVGDRVGAVVVGLSRRAEADGEECREGGSEEREALHGWGSPVWMGGVTGSVRPSRRLAAS